MDSDDFGLWIFKDEDCTQQIAVIDAGVKIRGDDLSKGTLNLVEIYPLVYTV